MRSDAPSSGRFDIRIDADDDGQAVDLDFGGFIAVAVGDRERLAGGGRTRGVQRDFDVEDVVLDGGFHGVDLLSLGLLGMRKAATKHGGCFMTAR